MFYDIESRSTSASSSEAHARLLYESLEQFNREQKRSRRPSIVLAALIVLLLSSVLGITLAFVLMAKVVDVEAACLSRDLVLFAGILSLVYMCLHIKGARRDYTREGPGPPQIYGHYLHASALLFARLGILVWIAALVATAILIARPVPLEGFAGNVPILNLLLCIFAIPPFLIISVTIERNPTPFATAAISSPSLLTCRVSEYADDLATDLSVSRRSSLKQKQSHNGSVLSLSTEDIFRSGIPTYEEKTSVVSEKEDHILARPPAEEKIPPPILPRVDLIPQSPIPPIPKPFDSAPARAPAPQPAYFPGGWRAEWENATTEEVGMPATTTTTTENPKTASSGAAEPQSQYAPAAAAVAVAVAAPPSALLSPPKTAQPRGLPTTANANASRQQQHRRSQRPVAASTSIASSAARSNLSTVRYAAQPEIAVRQPITVVRNPAYVPPASASAGSSEKPVAAASKPDAVTLLRNAQRAQKTGMGNAQTGNARRTNVGNANARTGAGADQGPRRNPSNFSRPTQRA
ncbi:hypothetical protein F5Y14DRAFT_286661 [Nemania sp. NC0429]|nr:hypothetical protein F5Y14DRAFT_286661 [Nemania sp. NC0429]